MTRPTDFYTLKGYSLLENTQITASMEDYLEMIYRLFADGKTIRINQLAEYLHVKPSSSSKMVSNLKEHHLVNFEKYGIISLTEEGIELGKYLLFRHETLNAFFCFINNTEEELKQVEKVEHFIENRTLQNLKAFLERCQ